MTGYRPGDERERNSLVIRIHYLMALSDEASDNGAHTDADRHWREAAWLNAALARLENAIVAAALVEAREVVRRRFAS